jgi:hypothetical protein
VQVFLKARNTPERGWVIRIDRPATVKVLALPTGTLLARVTLYLFAATAAVVLRVVSPIPESTAAKPDNRAFRLSSLCWWFGDSQAPEQFFSMCPLYLEKAILLALCVNG